MTKDDLVFKDTALKMAHKTFMQMNERWPRKDDGSGYFDKEINACKKALEQPAQEPLSDDAIAELWGEKWSGTTEMIKNFARAIEKAHGIGE